jgi:hypothetical protein
MNMNHAHEAAYICNTRSLTMKEMMVYAVHENSEFRHSLIIRNHLPLKILEIMANDLDSVIRENAAYGEQCSPALLRKFLSDSSYFVRLAASRHPKCPSKEKLVFILEN